MKTATLSDTAPDRFKMPCKTSTLSDKLDLTTLTVLDLLPDELMEVIREAYTEIGRNKVTESALKEGDLAPDFSLFDVRSGRVVSSAALRQEGPVVLNFFRGGWCKYDQAELQCYNDLVSEFKAKGASVVSVAAEGVEGLKAVVEKENLDNLTVLSDSKFQVAACFGLTFDMKTKLVDAYTKCGIDVAKTNDMNASVLPLAATYVIGQEGRIVYSFVDCDPAKRAEPADVLAAVPEKCAPPISIDKSGMDSASSIASILSAISTGSAHKSPNKKKSKKGVFKKIGRVLSTGKKQLSKPDLFSSGQFSTK